MKNRGYSGGNYRYGFNGKELDGETAADAYDFGARIYDARLGRWMAVDPIFKNYKPYSTFLFALNSPIYCADIDGRDIIITAAFLASSYYPILKYIIANRVDLGISQYVNYFMGDPSNGTDLSRRLIFHYTDNVIVNGSSVAAATIKKPNTLKPVNSTYSQQELRMVDYCSAGNGSCFSFSTSSNLTQFVTIMHELLHIDPQTGNEVSHNEMSRHVSTIASALMKYAHDVGLEISKKGAEALAWVGLEQTNAFKSIYGDKDNRNDLYKEWKALVKRYGMENIVENKSLDEVTQLDNAFLEQTKPLMKTTDGVPASDDTYKKRLYLDGNDTVETDLD
jgi:RHS repeat-associated protein